MTKSDTRTLLSGNEAIAQGAFEAGVTVGTGYPGTPSTEILEHLATFEEVRCEWSVNEKVALEVALGASLAGARVLVTMKHVGVNVAADPLFTAVYTGIRGGLVVVTADDPSMHSSQNEQDNRYYALAAKLPMIEPSDAEEARRFTALAFELSEKYDTPVFLRSTTRLSHSKSLVTVSTRNEHRPSGFVRDRDKYIMIPQNAVKRRRSVETRLSALREEAEKSPLNLLETGSGGIGFITSGISYTYVREAFPDAPVLKLGLVHPLPRRTIQSFARSLDRLFVVEELEPFIENQISAMGIPCTGKAVFPCIGELSPDLVSEGVEKGGLFPVHPVGSTVVSRPPGLCPGCPHAAVFEVLNERGLIVTGDIGCYTLVALPPYEAIDTCVDMGASIGMAQGIDMALSDGDEHPRVAAVIGDSTFAHSGITGLLNACWNNRSALFIVLDNGTTAMTGMQPNPLSGETIYRKASPALDYRYLAKAFGIGDAQYRIVDAYDRDAVRESIDTLLRQTGVRLLVLQGLCVMERKRRRRKSAKKATLAAGTSNRPDGILEGKRR